MGFWEIVGAVMLGIIALKTIDFVGGLILIKLFGK